jgi:putative restriction endonuclease
MTEVEVLVCPSSLRRHQRAGQRSPHKSLLVLYVLGQLAATGASAVAWSAAVEKPADLNHDVGSGRGSRSVAEEAGRRRCQPRPMRVAMSTPA